MIKMRNKIFAAITAVVCLNSCHVYKAYERPEINVSDSLFRNTDSIGSDTASLASLSWRELFRDSELQKLIELGLKNNADINIAGLKVKEAEARLLSSKLSFLPSLSLTPQGNINKAEGMPSAKSFTLAASAQWEIDAFGKQLSRKRGAASDVFQAEAYRQAVQTELIAMIANNYYTLLMLDSQADIARKTCDNWKESVRTMKGLMRAGEADLMAVKQTEANLFAVEASLVDIEQQINEVENSLSTLLGMPAQGIVRTSLESQYFPEKLSTGVPLNMLSNRPDVRGMEMKLASAFYNTETARSAFYPSITLGGNAGWTNNATGRIKNPAQWLFSAIGSVVQPIFNKGTNIANLKIAEAKQQEALIAFQQSILDAGKEVNNALMQWQSAGKRIELDEKQVASLNSALKSSELMMKYSSQNYLAVINARQALLKAEMDVVTDRFDKIQGIINLYHALGGGSK